MPIKPKTRHTRERGLASRSKLPGYFVAAALLLHPTLRLPSSSKPMPASLTWNLASGYTGP